MKTRYKIIIITIMAFVLISFTVPNLSKVYGSCEMTQSGTLQFAIGYQWTNGFLYIDNAECTWKLFGVIPITSILSGEIRFQNFSIVQYAYAGCAATILPQPCFDSFMGFTDQDASKKTIMENFHKHMESRHGELQIPDRTWDSYETPIQLPAILCTEFVVDGMKQYRMAQWTDYSKISSWENHYNPLLCAQWLAPIDDGIKLKWDKELYPSNDIAVIHVTDKDMNLDPTIRDVFEIHVWSDTDHGGIQLTVTETENDTGIFYAKVYLTTTNVSSGARLLVEDAVNAGHKGNRISSKIINESNPPYISEEHTCDSGYEYAKGDCHIIVDSPYTYLRILFTYPVILLLVFGAPSLIVIVLIYSIRRKRK